MKVTFTRDEIEQHKYMLDMLRELETLRSEHVSIACVTLSNSANTKMAVGIGNSQHQWRAEISRIFREANEYAITLAKRYLESQLPIEPGGKQ